MKAYLLLFNNKKDAERALIAFNSSYVDLLPLFFDVDDDGSRTIATETVDKDLPSERQYYHIVAVEDLTEEQLKFMFDRYGVLDAHV